MGAGIVVATACPRFDVLIRDQDFGGGKQRQVVEIADMHKLLKAGKRQA
jgi:hypothetical protein